MEVRRVHFSFWTQLDTVKNVELSKIWQHKTSSKQIIPERFTWFKVAFIFPIETKTLIPNIFAET